MGYTTSFEGKINITPTVTDELKNYINTLASTRRMKRDVSKLQELYNGKYGYNGEYGIDGEYFAKDDSNWGQSEDASILDYNYPPSTQPGLWLQWNITEDGVGIEWDGGEKFYKADEWMEYIIDTFLSPNGYVCNGEIYACGEDSDDRWKIVVKDNNIVVKKGSIVYED